MLHCYRENFVNLLVRSDYQARLHNSGGKEKFRIIVSYGGQLRRWDVRCLVFTRGVELVCLERPSLFGSGGVLCYQDIGSCGVDSIEWWANKLLANCDWDGVHVIYLPRCPGKLEDGAVVARLSNIERC